MPGSLPVIRFQAKWSTFRAAKAAGATPAPASPARAVRARSVRQRSAAPPSRAERGDARAAVLAEAVAEPQLGEHIQLHSVEPGRNARCEAFDDLGCRRRRP